MEDIKREFETVAEKKCPICNSDKTEFLLSKYDDRFGQPDSFDYYLCNKCNIAFIQNKIKRELLTGLYGKYYITGSSRESDVSFMRKIFTAMKLSIRRRRYSS